MSYCTNVHPGTTVEEIITGLRAFTIPARQSLHRKIAAGLWIPATAVKEIEKDAAHLDRLRAVLADGDVVCYTLNTFPYGNFHSERVKEQVYLPDWATLERLNYTRSSARILAELMPEGTEGSLSTVPLGFKAFEHAASFEQDCIAQLLNLARMLDELHDDTGKVLRLAIEPEPLCVLETTSETVAFFERLFEKAADKKILAIAQRHLGVCYDVCHQSVEFEDVRNSISQLSVAGIRINKVHITCALQLTDPGRRAEARQQLAAFAEPRYLHQTFARHGSLVTSILDLTPELCLSPAEGFRDAEQWRVHFHVPVHNDSMGELETTREDLKAALQEVARLEYAPHLEVETYTWSVLPGGQSSDLVKGLIQELSATHSLLEEITAS